MATTDRWEWETVQTLDRLELDPENPRLPKRYRGASQRELLEVLSGRFDVESLAEAIVTAGYLEQDPIAGYAHYGRIRVREGNRRVAAIKLLLDPSLAPERYRARFEGLAARLPEETRENIAELEVQVWHDRADSQLTAYIGYRHVTGIRDWPAVEKARFITDLIDTQKLTYDEVAGRIGTKPRHVERHYVAYKVVQQAFEAGIPGAQQAEAAFGVMLRALQTNGVADFLGVTFDGEPDPSVPPVPVERLGVLGEFLQWTFGTPEQAPILNDSAHLAQWATILASHDALDYLRRSDEPTFERAWERSGGEASSLADALYNSAEYLRDAVPIIADHKDDDEVREALHETVRFFRRLAQQVPGLVEDSDPL